MGGTTKRDRLISSAAELFHKRGILSTSLADIAKDAEIPIGNVYYYFKTKDELATSALERRRQSLEEVYDHLEANYEDPRERLIEAVRFFDKVKLEYTRYGCPIYRMIIDGGDIRDEESVSYSAADIYRHFAAWCEEQFRALGHGDSAPAYAASLLAGIQGGAVMAQAFSDSTIMENELERLEAWLESIPNRKIFLGKAGAKRA